MVGVSCLQLEIFNIRQSTNPDLLQWLCLTQVTEQEAIARSDRKKTFQASLAEKRDPLQASKDSSIDISNPAMPKH